MFLARNAVVFNIFHDEDDNVFYNECGIKISNIFEILSPNDLFLYRKDPIVYTHFHMKDDPTVICEIITTDQ